MKKINFKIALGALALVTFLSGCGEKNPDEYLALELKYESYENALQPTLKIQAKNDIVINSVSVNRGNCKIALTGEMSMLFGYGNMVSGLVGGGLFNSLLPKFTLEKDLPKEMAFSEEIKLPIGCSMDSVLETTINTNQGVWTWTWNK